ncbi:hypothetical protein OC842_005995 [Tilletia horrida]|uniref:RGS domain-containing protein n=1 Tax=Tilletia horrida TaxID=155126 RepID=A0AAN6JIF7_9BASI|nr:hypothetical protein OC842_005995 [Tilletia horrida]
MSASDSSIQSHLPTRTRQQTSSRMMKTTRRGRPFAKDTHDLFATLIVSLQLTTHRQYFKSYPNSFTTDEAAENLSALKFSQSNRAPDPNEPSRVITTTTTTTFSMNREMAKGICQHFMDARLIENAADMSSAIFKERGVYMLTPKGLHILERFITKNGINGEHLLKVFSSQPICMKLLHLERRPSDDELLINTPVLYVIFRRFVGRAPNYPYGQGRIPDSAAGPHAAQGVPGPHDPHFGANPQEFDRTLGVEMADLVEKPPKGSANKTAVLYRHTFTAIAALDWLCDFTTVCGRDEAAELASHFVRLGLIELVIDRSRKDADDRAVVVVQGEDPAVPGQWTEGEIRCSHKAIYTVTPLGRAIARWEGYEALQPTYLARFQPTLASQMPGAAGHGSNAISAHASPHLGQSPSGSGGGGAANHARAGAGGPLHSNLSSVAGPSALRESGDYAQARSASPSLASLAGSAAASAATVLAHSRDGDGAESAAAAVSGSRSTEYDSSAEGGMEHMRSQSASGRSLTRTRSHDRKTSRSNLSSSGSEVRLPRVASTQADRLRSDYLSGQDADSQGSSPSSSSAALSSSMHTAQGLSANAIHAHAIALAIANEQSSYNQRDSNTNRLKQILEEPALRTLFREFLKNNFCEENLSFWLDVQDFKRRFHTTSSAVAVRATSDRNDDERSAKRDRADKDALSSHSGSSQGNVGGGVAIGLSNVVRRLGNKALGPTSVSSGNSSSSGAGAGASSSSSAAQHSLNAMEKHQQDLITMALVIYNTYLAPSSPCELNIEHNLRTELVGYMKRVLSNEPNAKTGLGGKEKELERRLAGIQLDAGASASGSSGAGEGNAVGATASSSSSHSASAAAARSAGNRPEFGSPSDLAVTAAAAAAAAAASGSPASAAAGLPSVALGPSGRTGVSAAAAIAAAVANSPYGPATLHASQLQTMVRLYERIQDHIFRLMATDSVPRFIKDARFQNLVRNVEEYSVALETSRSGGIVGVGGASGLGVTGASYIGPEDESAAWANVTAQAGPGGIHPEFQVRNGRLRASATPASVAGTGMGAGAGAGAGAEGVAATTTADSALTSSTFGMGAVGSAAAAASPAPAAPAPAVAGSSSHASTNAELAAAASAASGSTSAPIPVSSPMSAARAL